MRIRTIHAAAFVAASAWAAAVVVSRSADAPCPRTPPVCSVSIPAAFEENRGQFDPAVRFVARTDGGIVFVARGEIVFAGGPRPIRMSVDGADADAPVDGVDELPGRANYFFGADPAKWRTDVPTWSRVRCRGIRDGLDLVGRFEGRRFEYDLVAAPGCDPSAIGLTFSGADALSVDEGGGLVVGVGSWRMVQKRPAVFQDDGGRHRPVDGHWVVDGKDRARFDIAGYDRTRALCIDPVVTYATYLGGAATEYGRALDRDASGNLYVAGRTMSPSFPTAAAYDSSYGGAGGQSLGDAFVAEINAAGTALVFSTYLGGDGDEEARGIAVDATGVYVGGTTNSTNPQFPTTAGVIRTTPGTGTDMFVAKIGPAGNLLWSTLIDGGGDDACNALVIDAQGDAYVTGKATANMPTTSSVLQGSYGGGASDAWVAELNPTGTGFVHATFMGGSGDDVGYGLALGIDTTDVVQVCGSTTGNFPTNTVYQSVYGGGAADAFVASVGFNWQITGYSRYLGGTGRDQANAIAVAPVVGTVYVTGVTDSTKASFPNLYGLDGTYGGGTDAFIYSSTSTGAPGGRTYFGGSGDDEGLGIWADYTTHLDVWFTGRTTSTDFPVTSDAAQKTRQGASDAFIAHMASGATFATYATYAGGSGDDTGYAIRVDTDGNPYVLGWTTSADIGASAGAVQTTNHGGGDAFLMTRPAGVVAPPPPPPGTVDAFFLPKTVIAKVNPKDASKSKLTASGFFDVGTKTTDLTHAATLTVGSLVVPVPAFTSVGNGKSFKYSANGLVFTIVPDKSGSSRAKFTLVRTGDLTNFVPQSGNVPMEFKNDVIDGKCTVALTNGKYTLGRIRGALVAPNLFLLKATAGLKGSGKDTLSLVAGLATNGTTPGAASDFTVRFGAGLNVTIPAGQFTVKGDKISFAGNASGVTSVVLDYKRETITVKGKALSLGSYADGSDAVTISIGLGTDSRAVAVRAVKKGTSLKY
jgi:hypothetical protein